MSTTVSSSVLAAAVVPVHDTAVSGVVRPAGSVENLVLKATEEMISKLSQLIISVEKLTGRVTKLEETIQEIERHRHTTRTIEIPIHDWDNVVPSRASHLCEGIKRIEIEKYQFILTLKKPVNYHDFSKTRDNGFGCFRPSFLEAQVNLGVRNDGYDSLPPVTFEYELAIRDNSSGEIIWRKDSSRKTVEKLVTYGISYVKEYPEKISNLPKSFTLSCVITLLNPSSKTVSEKSGLLGPAAPAAPLAPAMPET